MTVLLLGQGEAEREGKGELASPRGGPTEQLPMPALCSPCLLYAGPVRGLSSISVFNSSTAPHQAGVNHRSPIQVRPWRPRSEATCLQLVNQNLALKNKVY